MVIAMLRSRLFFAVVFLLSLALGIFYTDHNIGFTIVYVMGFLFLSALVTILAAPYVVRIREEADADAVLRGESVVYRLTIVNRSPFLYPGVAFTLHSADVTDYGEAFAGPCTVLPGQKNLREATLRFPYRGDYPLGIRELVITDFLGLFHRAITGKTPVSVLVYPVADKEFSLSLMEEPESVSRRGLFSEDYSAMEDTRQYTSSDHLRKIHWPLSAARGELIVRSYASYDPAQLVLLLDTARLPLAGIERAAFEDKMAGYAAAAVAYCEEGRLPATLVLGDGEEEAAELAPGSETTAAYALLAGVPFDREGAAFSRAGSLGAGGSVLLFLHGMDGESHDAVCALMADGRGVTLYLFYAEAVPLTEEKRLYLESLAELGAVVHTVAVHTADVYDVDAENGRESP